MENGTRDEVSSCGDEGTEVLITGVWNLDGYNKCQSVKFSVRVNTRRKDRRTTRKEGWDMEMENQRTEFDRCGSTDDKSRPEAFRRHFLRFR